MCKNKKKSIQIPYIEYLRLLDKINNIAQQISVICDTQREFLTPQDVCELLQISRTTFETYKNNGIFPCYNLKGRVFVKRDELTEAITNSKIKAKQ